MSPRAAFATIDDVTSSKRQWLVPAGLILLTLVPAAAGADRVTQLAAGAQVTADNARFFASPVPVITHIVAATLYCALGAFQFVPRLRRQRWHRLAGRLLIPCGLAVALSGLWMTLFYPRPADVGTLLTAFRLVFASAMLASIVLGLLAVRRRDFDRHADWMTRAYAIGIGAGTQVFTHLPWILLVGPVGKLSKGLLMLAGWLINLAVAEWTIRRRRNRKRVRPQWTIAARDPGGERLAGAGSHHDTGREVSGGQPAIAGTG
jgi:uncharacterized membrane protein